MSRIPILLGLALSAGLVAPGAFAGYQYRVIQPGLVAEPVPAKPSSGPLAFNLATATLPAGTRGVSYTYDFGTLLAMSGGGQPAASAVSWGTDSTLPAGLSLSAAGVLSGTPSVSGTTPFQITASYADASAAQSYEVTINGQPMDALQVTAGRGHSCALLTNGTVKCWGSNSFGQLGDGTLVNSFTPVTVGGLAGTPVQLAAGDYHTCARLSTGTVQCWGRNNNGQLGDKTGADQRSPVNVYGLTGVTDVAASGGVTCFITGGGAYCTGANNWANLGDRTMSNRTSPVQVLGLAGTPVSVAVADYHTCVLNTAGAVQCWGYNDFGQLGDGTATARTSPVTAIASGATQVSAVSYGTCARLSDGTAKCWGYNEFGQVGDGSVTNRRSPTLVALTNVSVVQRGFYTSCAIQGADIKCWGRGGGTLGNGTSPDSRTPVTVLTIDAPPRSLAMSSANGGTHACAALASGAVRCWGDNNAGQLGDGTTTVRYTPVTPGL